MILLDLMTNNPSETLVTAVLTLASALVTLITTVWVNNRKKSGVPQAVSHRSYIQHLQADKSRLIADLTNCMERGEKQAEKIARLTAENEALRREHEATRRDLEKANKKIEILFKAVHRLDPTLKDTFGSDFIPL